MIRKDDIKRIIREAILGAPLDAGFIQIVDAIERRIDDYFAQSEPWIAIVDRDAPAYVSRRYLVKNTFTGKFHSSTRNNKLIRYEFEHSAKAVAERLNKEGR